MLSPKPEMLSAALRYYVCSLDRHLEEQLKAMLNFEISHPKVGGIQTIRPTPEMQVSLQALAIEIILKSFLTTKTETRWYGRFQRFFHESRILKGRDNHDLWKLYERCDSEVKIALFGRETARRKREQTLKLHRNSFIEFRYPYEKPIGIPQNSELKKLLAHMLLVCFNLDFDHTSMKEEMTFYKKVLNAYAEEMHLY